MSREDPLVSVTINTRNGERYLGNTLKSLLASTYQNWEALVWDNMSVDSTPDIVKGFNDPRIHYFRGTIPLSLGEARNAAIAKARGAYVAILDSDDLWEAEKLNKQVELFKNNKSCVCVYSDTALIDGDGNIISESSVRRFYRGNVLAHILRSDVTPPWPSVMMKKETVLAVGGFDPRYTSAEDKDILLKLADSGDFEFIPESLCRYRVHEEQESRNYGESVDELLQIADYWRDIGRDRHAKELVKESERLEFMALYKGVLSSITVGNSRNEALRYLKKMQPKQIELRMVLACICFVIGPVLSRRLLSILRN
jgi:glycosyltransferase involved in cell wall biosynthesis